MSHKNYRIENECLNCGATVIGKFCHKCGQENLELKENFFHQSIHAIGDYFHFDAKFFGTLQPLLFQPGRLTNEYNSGKRTSYLHPIRIYLFISILYFFLSSFLPEQTFVKFQETKSTTGLDSADQDLDSLQLAEKNNTTNFHLNIKSKKDTLVKSDSTNKSWFAEIEGKASKNLRNSETRKKALSESGKKLPKVMFFMIPVFALFSKLSYRRSKKYYTEHLIFSLHFHSFYFLTGSFLIAAHLFLLLFNVKFPIEVILPFIAAIYLFLALKKVFVQNNWKTLLKELLILFAYIFVLAICIFFVAIFTFATVH